MGIAELTRSGRGALQNDPYEISDARMEGDISFSALIGSEGKCGLVDKSCVSHAQKGL